MCYLKEKKNIKRTQLKTDIYYYICILKNQTQKFLIVRINCQCLLHSSDYIIYKKFYALFFFFFFFSTTGKLAWDDYMQYGYSKTKWFIKKCEVNTRMQYFLNQESFLSIYDKND